MAKKSKHKQSQSKPKQSQAKPQQSQASGVKHTHKERGFWLSLALAIMAVHGIIASYLFITLQTQASANMPLVIGLMILHSLANLVAAVGIWFWKKWSLYVYAVSTILALVAGLISVGAWSVFYMVLPLAIVGWLLRTKWDYFE